MILDDEQIMNFVSPYTMVGRERVLNVLKCVEYVVTNNIEGDLVEIGVWKGGVIMAMALKCLQLGVSRTIHVYDTFEGMTPPTDKDIDIHNQQAASILESVLCYSSFDETKSNIDLCQYPNIVYHKGDITKTNIQEIPIKIAVLRLDTDWYELTRFELMYFEPNVPDNGFIIIDDYGYWKGCRLALDEFFEGKSIEWQQIDVDGIYWQKKSILSLEII